MKTVVKNSRFCTVLRKADRDALRRIATTFAPHVSLEPLGRYRTMADEEVWLAFIGQVCVMGSAGPWERLQGDGGKFAKFQGAVSLSVVAGQKRRKPYLEKSLREFFATRFPGRAAQKLAWILQDEKVFRKGKPALFGGLSFDDDSIAIRDGLVARCPIFRLKSASDFMISVGLSHDVIALDTRIVGLLRTCFDYNRTSDQVQSNRELYLSVETALRGFAQEQGISLALLDRLLFQFSNLSAIEFVARYPQGPKQGQG